MVQYENEQRLNKDGVDGKAVFTTRVQKVMTPVLLAWHPVLKRYNISNVCVKQVP